MLPSIYTPQKRINISIAGETSSNTSSSTTNGIGSLLSPSTINTSSPGVSQQLFNSSSTVTTTTHPSNTCALPSISPDEPLLNLGVSPVNQSTPLKITHSLDSISEGHIRLSRPLNVKINNSGTSTPHPEINSNEIIMNTPLKLSFGGFFSDRMVDSDNSIMDTPPQSSTIPSGLPETIIGMHHPSQPLFPTRGYEKTITSSSLPLIVSPTEDNGDENLFITIPYKAVESPQCTPLSYTQFISSLDDIRDYNIYDTNALIRSKEPLAGVGYKDAMDLYRDGFSKLVKAKFIDVNDATLSLKAVIQRTFRMLSAYPNKDYNDKLTYYCSKKSNTNNGDEICEAVNIYFKEGFTLTLGKCKWKCILSQENSPGYYYFSYVDALSSHTHHCFAGRSSFSSRLIKIAIDKLNLKRLTNFNTLLCTKLGINITKRTLSKHLYFRNVKAEGRIDYCSFCAHGDYARLNLEDKKIVGSFIRSKMKEGIYEYEYSTTGDHLDFVACLHVDQKEVLSLYSDLIFLDGTYNISSRKCILLNLVVIDNHYRSVIAATAFVMHEDTENYVKFLSFVKNSVVFKRLPICIIADGGLSIHKAVATVFPYCKHIYCTFHLLREGKLFGNKNSMSAKKKEYVKTLIRVMFITTSVNRIKEIEAILKGLISNDNFNLTESRISESVGNAWNGARPNQDYFSGNSVSDSRVEGMNGLVKKIWTQ